MIRSVPNVAFDEALLNSSAQATPYYTSIIIPVYNEEQALPHVLQGILRVVDDTYEVIVVDDGSHDDTYAVATQFPCRVISHEVNQGKGAAMKTGFRNARGKQIIIIDGDATYPPEYIPQIAEQLQRYDVVRGVRNDGRENIPWFNRLGNDIFDHIIRSVHQVDGADMLTGLYGLQKRHLITMRLESDGFDIESEIMIKARGMHLTQHTIPIQYNERIGEKKLAPLRDGLKILGRVLSLMLMYNPFMTYILPGLLLWFIAVSALVLLGHGPLITPFVGLSTNTLIVSAMSFLAGFQLVVFGCVVNLYAAETGLGHPSRTLSLLATRSPRLGGMVLGFVLVIVGASWTLLQMWDWFRAGLGAFNHTETLVTALALMIWGIQLLSTILFLSLFAGSRKFQPAGQPSHAATSTMPTLPQEIILERAVGKD